ncbi:MAG TPA: hypothetical protein VK498_15380 [Ferruginibacter sp.]|nr:hypothetical protein [Ferruginibacter sp.]
MAKPCTKAAAQAGIQPCFCTPVQNFFICWHTFIGWKDINPSIMNLRRVLHDIYEHHAQSMRNRGHRHSTIPEMKAEIASFERNLLDLEGEVASVSRELVNEKVATKDEAFIESKRIIYKFICEFKP